MLYLAIIVPFVAGWSLRGSLTRAQSAVDHKTSMIAGYKLCMFDIGRHRYANSERQPKVCRGGYVARYKRHSANHQNQSTT